MSTNKSKCLPKITINNKELENVNIYDYLGSMINSNGDCSKEVTRRLAIAMQKLNTMKKMWQNISSKN
jgi:hypothetical protein